MGGDSVHHPVMLGEVLTSLNLKTDGFYIDCTYGRGGHAKEILNRLGDKGRLLAIDKDPEAVASAQKELQQDSRFVIERGSFTMLRRLAKKYDVLGEVDGILFDLGVSSPQLDDSQRGFSFQYDGPLDMRMDPDSGLTAAEWIASANEKEITSILYSYGEERHAKRIARAIVRSRLLSPIKTTRELAEIATKSLNTGGKGRHPATKSFQAIRIFINNELEELKEVLSQVIDVLDIGGRLVIISFHSLEDRIVKRFIRDSSKSCNDPVWLSASYEQQKPRLRPVGKYVAPSLDETNRNVRARSAKLRLAERIA